eukprot:TRINITY_DN54427_c0_g1_i1.p1 TRINITY_DN54427_c0_g1~~TRINITY_DN54427_c0_g1_i1.p1  ORF type:complete len:755 (-),score=65.29 TRINITY_DN54427_c0_g1_i1:32-2296(-)
MGIRRRHNRGVSSKGVRCEAATTVDGQNGPSEATEGTPAPREPLLLENADFESYYQCQQICTAAEWQQFLDALRTSLPAGIRINAASPQSAGPLLAQLRRLKEETNDDNLVAPRQLPWYPGGLAWQWDHLSAMDIKKRHEFKSLKQYLGWLQSHGALTRQEAVSMIPPLCLDVKPGDFVLDLCAAPGSKASQLLELLQWARSTDTIDRPGTARGVLVANEINSKRADVLKTQVERFCSPCAVVTQFDAQYFPNLSQSDQGDDLKFNRVLADVPCSGDGTMRKFPEIWTSWSPKGALGLHPMQYSILCRGLSQLKVGGRLVYSTCSFNPVEDEAVVAAALQKYGCAVKLVPLPHLDGLHGNPGLQTWRVPHPEDARITWQHFEDVPPEVLMKHDKVLRRSVFPPAPGEEATAWSQVCGCCRRFLPHIVGSGGFFVAVFEKVAECTQGRKACRNKDQSKQGYPGKEGNTTDEALDHSSTRDANNDLLLSKSDCKMAKQCETEQSSHVVGAVGQVSKRKLQRMTDYELIPIDDPSWRAAAAFFGLDVNLASRLVRSKGSPRNVYYVTDEVMTFINSYSIARPRLLHAGVRALVQMGGSKEQRFWRLGNEGVRILLEHGLQRQIRVSCRFLSKLLQQTELSRDELDEAARAGEVQGLESLAVGPAVIREKAMMLQGQSETQLADTDLLSGSLAVTLMPTSQGKEATPDIVISALLSKTTLSSYVPRAEAVAMLELLELEERTTRILRASSGTQADAEA